MQCKKSLGREVAHHPTRVASSLIRDELRDLQLLGDDSQANLDEAFVASSSQCDNELGDLYERHPVTLQALEEGF